MWTYTLYPPYTVDLWEGETLVASLTWVDDEILMTMTAYAFDKLLDPTFTDLMGYISEIHTYKGFIVACREAGFEERENV